MVSVSGITGVIKKAAGKPASVFAKAAGAATIAAVVYDSHVNGKEKAASDESLNSANRFYSDYKNYMTDDSGSATIAKIKGFWNDSQPYSLYRLCDKVKGYFKGAGETIAAGLPFIGLGIAALKFKKVGKIAGLLLGLNGVRIFADKVAGAGHKKEYF